MLPNFTLLDLALPDVARLVTAMVQARDAVDRRSWSHPQELTSEECCFSSCSCLCRLD
jgi:hypothetical protein